MKNIIPVLLIAIFLFSSCDEEIGPTIDLGVCSLEEVEDVSPVPSAESKRVFMMEFSGGNCSNCPKGAEAVEDLIETHGDDFIPVTIHSLGLGPISEPATGATQNFQLEEGATYAASTIVFGIPSAAADLTATAGNPNPAVSFTAGAWEPLINARLQESTPVNLSCSGSFDENDNIRVNAELVYTEDVNEAHFITFFVVESHIIDYQLDGSDIVTDYEHNHIVRSVLPSTAGSVVIGLEQNKSAGTKVTKGCLLDEVPDVWNKENLEVVVIVHKEDQEVVQVAHAGI